MFKKEKIYIAGPECFYQTGYARLHAMKSYAESLGFGVTLPNSHPLDMENPDLQKRADSIFADLKAVMKETTVIIADLEAYRGSEPDSGSIYEIGMAYADGIRCYGYTRDKRSLAWKDQKYTLKNGIVYDEHNCPAPYKDLPFSPAVVGSTKIIQGDFYDCLHVLMTDIEEEWKARGRTPRPDHGDPSAPSGGAGQPLAAEAEPARPAGQNRRPVVYLADLTRYHGDAKAVYEKQKALCRSYGLDAITPLDRAAGIIETSAENPYAKAAGLTRNYLELIKSCDAVIAELNDYRGYECANDVAFECGAGFELGKKLFGYMKDTRPCIEKIPHYGEQAEFRDMTGSNVENFNYPANLMFGSSMDICQGSLEAAVKHAAQQLTGKTTFPGSEPGNEAGCSR